MDFRELNCVSVAASSRQCHDLLGDTDFENRAVMTDAASIAVDCTLVNKFVFVWFLVEYKLDDAIHC